MYSLLINLITPATPFNGGGSDCFLIMKKYRKYCPNCANIERWKCWKCWKCWKFWLYVFGIIVLAVILPTTLLTTFHCPFFGLNTDFTETGQIGDTIGGITAPIVGLLSIWLLYKTFGEQQKFNARQEEFQNQQQKFNKEQVRLNQKQLRVDNYNLYINLHNLLHENIDSILVTYMDNKQSIGFEVFMDLNKDFKISVKEFNNIVCQLKNLDHLIEKFLQINHRSDIEYANRKVFYENTIKYIDKINSYYNYLSGDELKIEDIEKESFESKQVACLKNEIEALNTKLIYLKREYIPKPRKKQTPNCQNTNSLPSCN